MRLSGGSACIKYLLFIFNLLFVVTGIVVLSVGAVIQGIYYDYNDFLDDGFLSVPSLLIAVGSIVLIVSFLGCCGAVKENHCMVLSFSITLMLVFILEMSGGIAGYLLRDRTASVIEERLNHTLKSYNDKKDIQEVWAGMQKGLHCCGISSYTDWETVYNNGSLPISCCDINELAVGLLECTANTTTTTIHPSGCLPALGRFVNEHAAVLGGVGIGIGFIQLLGVVLACLLARHIRSNYENV